MGYSKKSVVPCRSSARPFVVGVEPDISPGQQGDTTMRFMVLVKSDAKSEAGVLPDEKLLSEMGKYNEELVKAGVMLAGEGLKPSSAGKRVRFSGKNRSVTDGPFAETKELIAGFWLWNVKSMDEAVEWAKKCPNPMPGDSDLELRPLFSVEDFAPVDPEGKEAAREEKLRQEIEKQAKKK
jgi:hypothetical protein